ncbi:MAG: PA2778 family cysteine peptidase [Woeseiaceae bacterium]|nr:PA2778 family cysteine peptidase [Woeseiaceae bacterium]
MKTFGTAQASALFVFLLLSGCSTIPPSVSAYGPAPSPLELEDTPFYSQQLFQCGPAALMTLLTASGVVTTLDAVTAQVYLPARQGSLQTEILAASRAAERVPYVLAPGLASITGELAAGRPVLVLQNLGVSWAPRWHYAVVVGTDLENRKIVLRSGTDARRITRTSVFLRTWRRSDFWAVTTLKPGELPADPDRDRYVEAVAGLEQTGHFQAARDAWRAGRLQWPNDAVIRFGLANTEFALGNFAAAEGLYVDMLSEDSGSLIARNNLAMTLVALGRNSEAREQINAALNIAGDSPLLPELLDTQKTILSTFRSALN